MNLIESMDTSTIRVDQDTGKGSVMDTIRMVLKCSSSTATTTLNRLRMASEELVARCDQLRINGKGKFTPVADPKTLIEIIWLLPGKKAREFRSQSAEKIVRLLGGDLSLVTEIEARHATLQSTEEGRATQEFLLDERQGAANNQLSEAPFWFQLMPDDEKKKYVLLEAQKHMILAKKTMALDEMDICKTCKVELQSVNQFSGRDEIEFADRIKDIQRRASGTNAVLASAPGDNSIIAVARPVDDSIDPETGMLIATPKLNESVRGPETSICNEAAKMGIKVGEKAGQVGKVAKRLYSERYGVEAGADIPKRETTFRSKPFSENTFWQRDSDILQEAIRMVCVPPEKT
ncbi:unnamed protein product, partial [Ectocarpus sp. 12 AP-2014]